MPGSWQWTCGRCAAGAGLADTEGAPKVAPHEPGPQEPPGRGFPQPRMHSSEGTVGSGLPTPHPRLGQGQALACLWLWGAEPRPLFLPDHTTAPRTPRQSQRPMDEMDGDSSKDT